MSWTRKWREASPWGLAVLRVATVAAFWQHPSAKFLHVPVVDYLANVQPISLVGFGGMLEIVFGAMVLVGFHTRAAVFLLSGEMAVAYFMMHASASFFPVLNGGEAAYLYCFIFLYLSTAGGGALSIDSRAETAERAHDQLRGQV